MRRRRLRPWCGALAVALVLASPAAAQNDTPQVDPESPAGTEYQLPIDRAREQAHGGGSSSSPGEAPLFGAGVERKPPRSGTKPRSNGDAGSPATPAVDPGARPPSTVRAQAPAPDRGAGGLALIGAGGVSVLALGGLAGLAWRRRSMRG